MLVLTETTHKVQCGGQSPGLKRTGQLRAVWVTVLMLMCSFPKYIFFSPSGSAFFCDCFGSLLLHGLSLVAASGGYSAVAVHWLLIAVASRCRAQALDHRPSSCGAQAWLLHSMQDLPGLGINRCLLHWQEDSLPLSHHVSPTKYIFKEVPKPLFQVLLGDRAPKGQKVCKSAKSEHEWRLKSNLVQIESQQSARQNKELHLRERCPHLTDHLSLDRFLNILGPHPQRF